MHSALFCRLAIVLSLFTSMSRYILTIALLIPFIAHSMDKSIEPTQEPLEPLTLGLFAAIEKNDVEKTRNLIAQGADVNEPLGAWETPLLTYAVKKTKNPEMVALLLSNGSWVDQKDINGFTPLMQAVASGSLEIVKILLAAGADPCARTHVNTTAMTICGTSSHVEANPEIMRILFDAGTDLNHQNDYGGSALLSAARSGRIKIVETVLNLGAHFYYPKTCRAELLMRIASSRTEKDKNFNHEYDIVFSKIVFHILHRAVMRKKFYTLLSSMNRLANNGQLPRLPKVISQKIFSLAHSDHDSWMNQITHTNDYDEAIIQAVGAFLSNPYDGKITYHHYPIPYLNPNLVSKSYHEFKRHLNENTQIYPENCFRYISKKRTC